MPRGDGTGPMGMGPMTGRAAGYCAGFGVPGYMNAGPGFGYRRALGRGFGSGYGFGGGRGWGRGAAGRGFGRRVAWNGMPYGYGPRGRW